MCRRPQHPPGLHPPAGAAPAHRACTCAPGGCTCAPVLHLRDRAASQPALRVLLARCRHYVENVPMNLLEGQDATCPHCWETINLTLDLSVPEQSYVEDCPVCCKPLMV